MNNRIRNKKNAENQGINLLAEGKNIRIKSFGYSMYPSIKPGSLLLIEPIKIKGAPVEGEIIAIKRAKGLIIHRLIRIEKKGGITSYIARGDSSPMADKPISSGMILGRITGAEITGDNLVPADISRKTRPSYFINRLRVIGIIIKEKVKLWKG
jgi:signal peptidase I